MSYFAYAKNNYIKQTAYFNLMTESFIVIIIIIKHFFYMLC